MALDPGTLSVTVEHAQDLKDCELFGQQDPYAIVRCGLQKLRTKTHLKGGTDPVWNETFVFTVHDENTLQIEIMDEDTSYDDQVGVATLSLAKARTLGSDHVHAPVMDRRKNKQRGSISVRLKYTSAEVP